MGGESEVGMGAGMGDSQQTACAHSGHCRLGQARQCTPQRLFRDANLTRKGALSYSGGESRKFDDFDFGLGLDLQSNRKTIQSHGGDSEKQNQLMPEA
jgi:hypothetical protein